MKATIATKVQNGETEKEIAGYIAKTLGCSQETAAKIANKLATDALNISTKALLGPLALVIAAVTAGIAIFKLSEKQKQKEIEANKKLAETNAKYAEEIGKANREEVEANEELYKQYIEHKNLLDDS
jgi:hypothetical protein